MALRSDEAREERREASADTRVAAEADAQAWANSFASTHDRLTPDAARELRARIQQFAHNRNERFTEQQLTEVMTHVLDHQPPRPGSNDPSVRAAAAEPLPVADPAVAHDGPANPGNPRPDDPNVLARERPDSSGADYSRLMKGGSNPNPNAPPNPNVVVAAYVPAGAPPPPPPPGVAVPPPPPGGVPSDDAPPPPPGAPLVADGSLLPPGTPVVAGAPILPGAPVPVDGEPPAPVRFMSLGEPVRGMTGEDQQNIASTFVEMRSRFGLLTSTGRPSPAPLPTAAMAGETVVGRLFRQATTSRGSASKGRGSSTEGRGGEDLDRTLALGFRRGRTLGSPC